MAFDVSSLPALVQRAEADLESQATTALRRSDQKVLARVHSGATYGLYGFLGNLSREILPDTCSQETLVRWAAMRKIPRTPAVSSTGPVWLRGAIGLPLSTRVVMQAADGRQFRVASDTVLSAERTLVPVVALIPGAAGNVSPGVTLSLVSPVAGVLDQVVVGESGLTAGTDLEELQDWRSRVVADFARVPHGGADDDYVTWAKEVAGVTRAWTVPNYLGPGTVGLFFVRDKDPDPIPSADALAAVANYLSGKRPTCAELYVLAPVPYVVDYTIKVEPDTVAVRSRVIDALVDLHRREGDLGVRMLWTHMGDAISNTPGEVDHRLVLPASDVIPARNQIPVFGRVTWL